MKTQVLRSVTFLALTASIYAVMVAFTSVSKSLEVLPAKSMELAPVSSSIEHWVTTKLGYPKLLHRHEGNASVLLRLKLDELGRVEVLACDAEMLELSDYVLEKVDGQKALVSSEYYGHDFEIKINFRQQ